MIRLARKEDLPRLLEIYAAARDFMRRNGNLTQWSGGYPNEEVLLEDIEAGRLYVLQREDGGICACFMLCDGPDPTYAEIFGGQWRADTPYGVIHRIAGDGSRRGVLAESVAFARQRYAHLRIDTHADNYPMQGALAAQGFMKRGTIYLADGAPRLAYDWIQE